MVDALMPIDADEMRGGAEAWLSQDPRAFRFVPLQEAVALGGSRGLTESGVEQGGVVDGLQL